MRQEYRKVMHRMHAGEELKANTWAAMVKMDRQVAGTMRGRRNGMAVWFGKPAFSLVASLVVVAMLSVGSFAWYMTPVSYLDLDINPSVEAGLNGLDRVVSVKGYNEDGERLVGEVNWKGKPVDEVVGELVGAAHTLGYLKKNEENAIALTTVTDKPGKAEKLAAKAREGAVEALDEADVEAEIVEQGVGLARVEDARRIQADPSIEVKVTPGKLHLIEKMIEKLEDGEDVNAADFYGESVQTIMKKAKGQEIPAKDGEDEAAETDGNGKEQAPGQVKKQDGADVKPNQGKGSGDDEDDDADETDVAASADDDSDDDDGDDDGLGDAEGLDGGNGASNGSGNNGNAGKSGNAGGNGGK